mgnify:CR=1 FL=1
MEGQVQEWPEAGYGKRKGSAQIVFERNLWGIAPEGLQIVEITFFGLEDVNDDAVVIKDDPLAARGTISVGGQT